MNGFPKLDCQTKLNVMSKTSSTPNKSNLHNSGNIFKPERIPSKKVADMLRLCNCDHNKLMVCQHPERAQLKCRTLTCPVLIKLSEEEFSPDQI